MNDELFSILATIRNILGIDPGQSVDLAAMVQRLKDANNTLRIQNKTLAEDKSRLDWLDKTCPPHGIKRWSVMSVDPSLDVRAAIDYLKANDH